MLEQNLKLLIVVVGILPPSFTLALDAAFFTLSCCINVCTGYFYEYAKYIITSCMYTIECEL